MVRGEKQLGGETPHESQQTYDCANLFSLTMFLGSKITVNEIKEESK